MTETMTETPTALNTDYHVVKVELHDVEMMSALLRDTNSFTKQDLSRLALYKRSRTFGNKVQVVYNYGKGCEKEMLGRFYTKDGLQGFPTDIRNPLLEKYYWDIDMENCHYHLVHKIADDMGMKTEAIQKYIKNRDAELKKVSPDDRRAAKTAFLKVAYGGNVSLYKNDYTDCKLPKDADLTLLNLIAAEMNAIAEMFWVKYPQHHAKMKKKTNPKFSLMSIMLQTEERKCLMEIDAFMKSKNRDVDIYIHDGCEIRKLEGELEFPKQLMRDAEAHVLKKLGYNIKLVNKPMTHNFEPPDSPNSIEVPSSVIVNDAFAAKKFAEYMGDNIIMDNNEIWVFEQGLWSNDPSTLRRAATESGSSLVFSQQAALGVKLFDYSGSVNYTKNMIVKLPDVLPSHNGWFDQRVHSDIGKLLFPDGIYDFKTGTFSTEFDPKIVFTGRMPRQFPEKNQELVDKIRKISFEDAFGPYIDDRDLFLHALMRAFIGDTLRKKINIGTGFPNSGKGMTVVLIKTCVGPTLCTGFNGNDLLYKSNRGESARDIGWIRANVRSRFAFGSEITVNDKDKKQEPVIDGALIKSISSGVDNMRVRTVFERESSFVNKATFFMFAQELPKISSAGDDGITNRIDAFQWSYSYVANPDPEKLYERKNNPDLANDYLKAEYGDAFFWLMVEEYAKWKKNEFAEPKTTAKILENRDEFVSVVDYVGILKQNGFKITRNEEDYVLFRDVFELFGEVSKTAVGRNLRGLGLTKKSKKIKGSTETVYIGIKFCAELLSEDSGE